MMGSQSEHDDRARQQQEPPLPGPSEGPEPVPPADPMQPPMTIIGGPAAQDSPDWRPSEREAQEVAQRGAYRTAGSSGELATAGSSSATIRSLFSSTTRSGRWRVPAVLTLTGGFSDTTLDLRDAVITSEVVELRLTDVFSSTKIIVPRGVGVDIAEGTAIFSDLKGDYAGLSDPGMYRVRIVHTGGFSSVRIKSLDPGEAEPKWWQFR